MSSRRKVIKSFILIWSSTMRWDKTVDTRDCIHDMVNLLNTSRRWTGATIECCLVSRCLDTLPRKIKRLVVKRVQRRLIINHFTLYGSLVPMIFYHIETITNNFNMLIIDFSRNNNTNNVIGFARMALEMSFCFAIFTKRRILENVLVGSRK